MPAAAAAAPVSYSDMTLEDYLMRYCDEQVRAPPPPAPARLSLPPAPSPSAADTSFAQSFPKANHHIKIMCQCLQCLCCD